MRQGTPTIRSLTRSLSMLEAVLAERDGRSIEAIARPLGLPRATAHRQIHTLLSEGYLVRLPSGHIAAGPRLISLAQLIDEKQLIVAAAAPVLHRLAAETGSVAQLGTLENEMVTYRIKTGEGAGDLFTKVGLQLEAYCTAIGKVLLANLPRSDREIYLANGPFPALTPNTITNPDRLRAELEEIAREGFAVDGEEIATGLSCLAVPVRGPDSRVYAAISVSRLVPNELLRHDMDLLKMLKNASQEIAANLNCTT